MTIPIYFFLFLFHYSEFYPVLISFHYSKSYFILLVFEVGGDGTATIVFKDGSAITIPGNQLVAQDPKAQDSTKLTAEKSTVKAPAQRVDVKDITHLTDEEKVKVAILQANGSALDGATINVAGDGTATITFPDGSVVTILGKDTVQQSAKGESVTQEATPEYKLENTPGGDKGGNTGS
ncbi:putative surface anchored protein (pseudogene) [Streptococcus pneumoniae]|nr:putative surface anchored protein (pseudogene) [Streptococcus pneumoniae]